MRYEDTQLDAIEVKEELDRLVSEKMNEPIEWIKFIEAIGEASNSTGAQILNAYNDDNALELIECIRNAVRDYYQDILKDEAEENAQERANDRKYAIA